VSRKPTPWQWAVAVVHLWRDARRQARQGPAQRPPWLLLAAGLIGLVVGTVRIARPLDGVDVVMGALGVVLGAFCTGMYVDRALCWLRERP